MPRKPCVGMLSATHKMVTKTVADYLGKCFSYLLTQNKGDAEGIRQGCRVIPKHAFGDHSLCGESWCKYLQNPETYKHQSLPHGKDLEGDDLKSDLEHVEWKILSNSTILIFQIATFLTKRFSIYCHIINISIYYPLCTSTLQYLYICLFCFWKLTIKCTWHWLSIQCSMKLSITIIIYDSLSIDFISFASYRFFSFFLVMQTSLPHLGQPRAMSHLITRCQFMPLNVCTFLVFLVWKGR